VHLVLPVKLFAPEEQRLQESEALLVTAHPTVRTQCQILALMVVMEVLLAGGVVVSVVAQFEVAAVME
jgi:hypothetical protein